MTRAWCIAFVVACMPASSPDTGWLEIRLRDPRRVAVWVDTPAGATQLVAPGAPAGTTWLPDTAPPFEQLPCRAARIIRGVNGATAIRRERCSLPDDTPSTWRGDSLVDADGRVVLFRPRAVRWIGDELAWRAEMGRQWREPCGRSTCVRTEELFSVELRTPLAIHRATR